MSVTHASLSAEVPPQNLEAEEALEEESVADELPREEPSETPGEPESD